MKRLTKVLVITILTMFLSPSIMGQSSSWINDGDGVYHIEETQVLPGYNTSKFNSQTYTIELAQLYISEGKNSIEGLIYVIQSGINNTNIDIQDINKTYLIYHNNIIEKVQVLIPNNKDNNTSALGIAFTDNEIFNLINASTNDDIYLLFVGNHNSYYFAINKVFHNYKKILKNG